MAGGQEGRKRGLLAAPPPNEAIKVSNSILKFYFLRILLLTFVTDLASFAKESHINGRFLDIQTCINNLKKSFFEIIDTRLNSVPCKAPSLSIIMLTL